VKEQAVAELLAQVTSGWQPVTGIASEQLRLARQALAATLAAGKAAREVHATSIPTSPAEPVLTAELRGLVDGVQKAGARQHVGVVRSAAAADIHNPSGVPAWARSAKVAQTLGPFKDATGMLHWVDLINLTLSEPVAFGSSSHPFGVFPVEVFAFEPATELKLGAGSLWFLAHLLAPAVDVTDFTGFAIQGGTLVSTLPFTFENGVFVVPAGAQITLTAVLADVLSPDGAGLSADAFGCVFVAPKSINVVFTQTAATLTSLDTATADAYGSSVTLQWNKKPVTPVPNLPEIAIPCDVTPASFTFAKVLSPLFTPSGSAPVSSGAWALPLSNAAIAALPDALGAGMALLEMGPGAELQTELQPDAVPIGGWLMEIATDGLYVVAGGTAKQKLVTFELWPEAQPLPRRSSVAFGTSNPFVYAFLASATGELLIGGGEAAVHLDRPLSSTGQRYRFGGPATLFLGENAAGFQAVLIGQSPASVFEPQTSIALTNALLGVAAPSLFLLVASLDPSGEVTSCVAALYFTATWLLPTLPDPYAANFDLSVIGDQSSPGTLVAIVEWPSAHNPAVLGFALLPAPANPQFSSASVSHGPTLAGTPFEQALALQDRSLARVASQRVGGLAALLDLSTRVDQFGVAVAPNLTRIAGGDRQLAAGSAQTAPVLALSGMYLELNGGLVATFALPQESWEPMESVVPPSVGTSGPLLCQPASDGLPLLLSAPNTQQLVRFTPAAVLKNNQQNVVAGLPFFGVFSLPFGLNAMITQENAKSDLPKSRGESTFLEAGGKFSLNIPQFDPKPAKALGGKKAGVGPGILTGAKQLTLMPPNPGADNASFSGSTEVDTTGSSGPFTGYGYDVLSQSVGIIFEGKFGHHGPDPNNNTRVPLRRIDFSGYGASIFSDWSEPHAEPPAIIKVQFETSIGRTGHEVVKAATVLYPYCVRLVRTITMQRQNAGWMQRTDSGWQAASQGVFDFPPTISASQFNGRLHKGALTGLFNVRHIREQNEFQTIGTFLFRKVLFDADIGIDHGLHVVSGGFPFNLPGFAPQPTLVASRDLVGYIQLAPVGGGAAGTASPEILSQLFQKTGPMHPAAACVVEIGAFGGKPGTVVRCSAFAVDMVRLPKGLALTPAMGAAMLAAPQIPRGGGWSLGHRKYNETAPAILPNDFPVPIVQPATDLNHWYLADLEDVLQVSQPDNFYSLLHATGPNKVLFEQPQIPASAAIAPVPGLQFPKPGPPGPSQPGAAPVNNGAPNLADMAALLNSTGLFPDIASVMSLFQGTVEQINTIGQGFHYEKSFTFDPSQKVTIIAVPDLIGIDLQYSGKVVDRVSPATLQYSVDSSKSPSWTLNIGPLSFLVMIPAISKTDPLLTISGSFHGDEHSPPGLTGLDVTFGDALAVLQGVFSRLHTLAQFLPGGATANLDVALSDGRLTVIDTFSIADLPLGLGNLTDVSLEMGLAVQLSPLSVDFTVGLGNPGNPFGWIVSPLAGNGLIDIGIRGGKPALTMQAGIGLGLAIDLGIASGSASVVIAFQIDVNFPKVTLMVILTGTASVDVLDGLVSASVTLSAALGVSVDPLPPSVTFDPALPQFPPTSVTIDSENITLLAMVSVGIHVSVCWVASVDWDGSWKFSQGFTTPKLTVGI